MKLLIVAYMALYLLIALASSFYSFLQTKKMNRLSFVVSLLCYLILFLCLISYAQAYQPLQMLVFVLCFTVISSLFFYSGAQTKDARFARLYLLHIVRLLVHVQLLILLYLFR